MLKAYHVTSREAFESILGDGQILPLALRAHEDGLRGACEDDITSGRYRDIPAEAIREMVEDFLSTRPNYQNRKQIDIKKVHTPCLEIIMGYGEGVMLNTGEPISYRDDMEWGFGFDAKELLRQGGRLITDITFDYAISDRLARLSMEFWKSSVMLDRVRWMARKAHEETELIGEKAANQIDRSLGFIFWLGPLSIEHAIEVVENGRIRSLSETVGS